MATTLIAILIVLLSTHALPDLARYRNFSWLRDWLRGPGDSPAGNVRLRTLLVAGLLVVLTGLIQAALHRHWFGVLELAFMVVVLFFCWGPRDLDTDIESVLKAPDSERRRQAAQLLGEGVSEQAVSYSAAGLIEASFAAALSRRFGVLFWFAVLGPVGALAYRLVQQLARSPAFAEAIGDSRADFERAALIMDWAPAHLLAWSLALVSDFDAIVSAWHDYHRAHGQGYFTLDLGFLAVIARAGVDADVAAGDGGEESVGDPLAELADTQIVLRRALYVWLAVIAVIVLGGWAT
ncbi:MAG: cobalamin biosynthesis protein [Dokdonella sp.]|nr:cobalamin biosynthesis protein [Dokdonella sp.]MCB1575495.1 cobalamin biosynthesis protein [Xanthomonadales bacterium]